MWISAQQLGALVADRVFDRAAEERKLGRQVDIDDDLAVLDFETGDDRLAHRPDRQPHPVLALPLVADLGEPAGDVAGQFAGARGQPAAP